MYFINTPAMLKRRQLRIVLANFSLNIKKNNEIYKTKFLEQNKNLGSGRRKLQNKYSLFF